MAVAVRARHTAEGKRRRTVAQLAVFGAEIVSPLGDAVGFIDGQAGQAAILEQSQRFGSEQGFGGDIEQLQLSGACAVGGGDPIPVFKRAIEESGGNVEEVQLIDLVLHEGDERRDHHRQAVEHECGQLVTERFATAGGHDGQGVVTLEHMTDHLGLAGQEIRETEDLFEQVSGAIEAGRRVEGTDAESALSWRMRRVLRLAMVGECCGRW